jgi:hypothetical protein
LDIPEDYKFRVVLAVIKDDACKQKRGKGNSGHPPFLPRIWWLEAPFQYYTHNLEVSKAFELEKQLLVSYLHASPVEPYSLVSSLPSISYNQTKGCLATLSIYERGSFPVCKDFRLRIMPRHA